MNIVICDFCKNTNISAYKKPCNSCNVLVSFSEFCYFEPYEWAKEAFEKHIKEIENND